MISMPLLTPIMIKCSGIAQFNTNCTMPRNYAIIWYTIRLTTRARAEESSALARVVSEDPVLCSS